jgi:Acyl-CoA thioesterase C-terminal domain/Acyl-CoA thioesterase N-terminal domain
MMTEAFYSPQGNDRFVSSDWTIGPWSPEAQHGGPPAALLGRAIERVNDRRDMQTARVTFEILRPVPIETLAVEAHVFRPGKSVELVHATLSAGDRPVMTAAAWRIRTTALELTTDPDTAPVPGPKEGKRVDLWPGISGKSYLSAMEWRFTSGAFLEPGPAAAWARMRHPLVGGEEISPLTRVLVLADSGNGISSMLDFDRWMFINPDLTVYLHRLPEGEWVHLDAESELQGNGVGLASSVLSDRRGAVGRGLQSLFIAPRP